MSQQNLVVNIVAETSSHCFTDITKACQQSECEIISSQMNTLDNKHVVQLFLTGNWGTITKVESLFHRLANEHKWHMMCERTRSQQTDEAFLAYTVSCLGVDRPDIPFNLMTFFNNHDCQMVKYDSSRYLSAHSRVLMQQINAVILIPVDTNLGTLREDFYSFCDEHNYEAILDPDRN